MRDAHDNFTIDYTSTHVLITMDASDVRPASSWASELFDTAVEIEAPSNSVQVNALDDGSIQIRVSATVWNRWGLMSSTPVNREPQSSGLKFYAGPQ